MVRAPTLEACVKGCALLGWEKTERRKGCPPLTAKTGEREEEEWEWERHTLSARLKRRNTRQQPLQEFTKVLGCIVVCSVSCPVNIHDTPAMDCVTWPCEEHVVYVCFHPPIVNIMHTNKLFRKSFSFTDNGLPGDKMLYDFFFLPWLPCVIWDIGLWEYSTITGEKKDSL